MFGMIPFDRRDDNLFDLFDNFEKKFFGNTNASLPAFRTDIRDQGDKFLLEAELPGFQKEDISLELKEGILTIKAEHKENQDQKDDKGNYIRRERRYGSFSRTFDVSGIDRERHYRCGTTTGFWSDPAQAGTGGAAEPADRHWLRHRLSHFLLSLS